MSRMDPRINPDAEWEYLDLTKVSDPRLRRILEQARDEARIEILRYEIERHEANRRQGALT